MKTKSAMITIAGRPNVGKSTLANALVGEKIAIVSNKPQTTRNRICAVGNRENTQLVFIDTPGFHRPRTKLGDYMVNVVKESVADVDAVILMVDPIANVGEQEHALLDQIRASGAPAMLVINKIDLAPYVGASLEVMERDSRKMRGERPFVFTNIRGDEHVDTIVEWIKKNVLLEDLQERRNNL